jgi:hypothetical protein
MGEQYNSYQLWYLLSTIYALIIIGVALKVKKNSAILLCISVIASIISIGLTELANYEGNLIFVISLFRKIIKVIFNNGRLFTGMVYIPIGMIVAYKKIPSIINWAGFMLGFGFNCFIDNSIVSSYLSIVTAISLFGIIERLKLKNNPIYSKLRNMSTLIYLIHMYVWTFYYKIMYGRKTYGVDCFVATAIISTVISLVYVVAHKKGKKYEH